MNKLPAQPIKGLQDGIAVLQQLANSREPVSSLELANELGIEKTRVNRILKTLSYLGIAYRTTSRRYTSGPGMHVLAGQALAASGLFHTSIRHLEDLKQYNCMVALGVLWRDKVSYLFFHSPGAPFYEGIGRTKLQPASASSLGMSLLARKTDEEILDIFPEGKPIDGFESRDKLLEEIRNVRENGYAILKSGPNYTVAVSIGQPAYAAIGVSGEFSREEAAQYVSILRDKAHQIENDLTS